jgi:hypothetical protein
MEPENVLVMSSCPLYTGRAGLNPIGPIAPNWARPRWIYLLFTDYSSTHNNTLHV